MGGDAPLLIACTAAVAAVLVLRVGWARHERSIPINLIGWSLMAVAALTAWRGDGAWGVAVATLAGMGAALALLTHAVATAPAGKTTAAASNRRAGLLPEGAEPLALGRRIATFLIVVPGALIASIALAVAARAMAMGLGAVEADGNAIAFFTAPLAWAILAFLLLLQSARPRQGLTLLIATSPVIPVLLSGAIA